MSKHRPISLDKTAYQYRETLQEMKKSVFTEQNPEEVLEELLEKDDNYQDNMNRQDKAMMVSPELAQEMFALLQESDGQFYNDSEGTKYIDWETHDIPYRILRRAGNSEAGRLVKNKRRLDLTQYARVPKRDETQRGIIFEFTNRNYSPTKEERRKLEEWGNKILDTFFFPPNEVYPNFTKFLGACYEDWFDLDDMTWEIRRDGLGKPLAIHVQDPFLYKPVIKKRRAPINFAKNDPIEEYLKDYETMLTGKLAMEEDEEPDYLLIHNEIRYAGVFRDNVRKHHFFTRSDYKAAQRGFGIVEQSINILTNIINAMKMNASNFNNSRMPDGLGVFTKGGVGMLQLEKLKKIMYAHISGTSPRRMPFISLKGEGDFKWANIRGNSRDMEFHLWMTLLFSIFCQLSGTDPREVSLGTHADAVGKKSLFEESSNGIIKESRDIGAKTFLTHIQDSLNTPSSRGTNIFQELTGLDIRARFIGFEMEDKKLKYEIREKELKVDKTLNDILSEEDKEKFTLMLPNGMNLFDVPGVNNPAVQQALNSLNQQAIQEKAMQAQAQQPSAGGEAQPENQQNNQEEELTDADKELLRKYGDDNNVDIDEELRKQILEGEI